MSFKGFLDPTFLPIYKLDKRGEKVELSAVNIKSRITQRYPPRSRHLAFGRCEIGLVSTWLRGCGT